MSHNLNQVYVGNIYKDNLGSPPFNLLKSGNQTQQNFVPKFAGEKNPRRFVCLGILYCIHMFLRWQPENIQKLDKINMKKKIKKIIKFKSSTTTATHKGREEEEFTKQFSVLLFLPNCCMFAAIFSRCSFTALTVFTVVYF